MGSPGVVEGKQTRRYCWLRRSLPWLSAPPSQRPLPMRIRQQTLLLTRGTDTTDGAATAATMAATTDPTDTTDTTARGLLMPTLLLTRLLTPGMATTATATDPGDTTDPTDTTTARGLLTPSPSPLPLRIPLPTLLPTPGTDTTDTGHTDMATGDAKTLATKLNIVLSLPTNTTEDQFLRNISLILFLNILFCLIGCRDLYFN